MEKADFLDRVAGGLASHGLTGETVSKYTDRVSALLDELPPDELKAILAGGIDVEAFVADLIKGEPEVEKAPKKPAGSAPMKPAAPKKPAEGGSNKAEPSKKTDKKSAEIKKEAPKAVQKKPAEAAQKKPAEAAQKKPAPQPKPSDEAPATPAKPKKEVVSEGDKRAEKPKTADERREKAPTERLPAKKMSDENGRLRSPGKISDNKDHTNFWILLLATSPIWLLLVAAVLVLFVAMIITFVVCIVLLVAVLIAVVVAGTALCLVGVIYGATQLFNDATLAVGLYELGQGIMIGGATIFVGIVLYNLAVRLSPWLIKQTVHMIGGFGRALKRLYYRVKGAMAR